MKSLNKQRKTSAKVIFSLIFVFFALGTANAQRISTQPHFSQVSAIAYKEDNGSVFSAGEDGMVINWANNYEGDHYQCSDLIIRKIAVHPNRNEIAIYETDDVSTYRVTVWDWTYKNKKYSKTLKDSVTCLSYSAQGTYLMIGTATLKGLNFFYADNGYTKNILNDSTGPVTMAKTSRTESSLVVYSPSGQLVYYDLKTGKEKPNGRFATVANLEQPVLYNNNMNFAGFADGKIHVISATSGKTEKTQNARTPVFCTVNSDSNLCYMDYDGALYTVYSIEDDTAKKLQALTASSKLCAGVKTATGFYFGSEQGDIYQIDRSDEYIVSRSDPITVPTYKQILDICTANDVLYMLTEDYLLKADQTNQIAEVFASNPGYTNLAATDTEIYLYSANTRNPITCYSLLVEQEESTFVYLPSSSIQSFKICGDKIVLLEGNSAVTIINSVNRTVEKRFTGTGYFDAELLNGTELYIGKSTATNPKSPMIMIDITTGETVSMNLRANAAYCLASDGVNLYGQMYTETKTGKTSSLFCFRPANRDYKALWSENGENISTMTKVINGKIYTDFSQDQVTVVPSSGITSYKTRLNGSSAQNLKNIAVFGDEVLVLNSRGTISAYKETTFRNVGTYVLGFDNEFYSVTSSVTSYVQ